MKDVDFDSLPLDRTVGEAVARFGFGSLVVGLSGGADSTALVCALSALTKGGLRLTAIHCNFHLRGTESDRDEEFCRRLCGELGVPLRVFQCPIDEWMATHKGSVEMACREIRYAIFRDVVRETGADAVAVAHNADDRAETFLLNLMRGAGMTGLKGMSLFRNGIFRPLISTPRSAILEFLNWIGRKYVTDSTNLESVYRRNFLRNKVLPLLEQEWPEAKHSINRSADIIERENSIIEWTLARLVPEGSDVLSRETARSFPDPESLFRRFLSAQGVSASLIHEIARTASLPYSGRHWDLSDGYRLQEERDGWHIVSDTPTDTRELIREEFEFDESMMARIRRAPLTEFWADATTQFEWRPWRHGDRIRPLGMIGSRLVSDVLTESKLPNATKSTFHVLALPDSNEVIWIPNLKRSRLHLVTTPHIVARYHSK